MINPSDPKFDGAALAASFALSAQKLMDNLELALQRNLKRQLSKPGTGRKHRSLKYRSSAPFNPPTVQTGTLRRSWVGRGRGLYQRRNTRKELRSRLASDVEYAKYLETGTRKMYPRPYLKTAVDITAALDLPKIVRAFERDLERRLLRDARRRLTRGK